MSGSMQAAQPQYAAASAQYQYAGQPVQYAQQYAAQPTYAAQPVPSMQYAAQPGAVQYAQYAQQAGGVQYMQQPATTVYAQQPATTVYGQQPAAAYYQQQATPYSFVAPGQPGQEYAQQVQSQTPYSFVAPGQPQPQDAMQQAMQQAYAMPEQQAVHAHPAYAAYGQAPQYMLPGQEYAQSPYAAAGYPAAYMTQPTAEAAQYAAQMQGQMGHQQFGASLGQTAMTGAELPQQGLSAAVAQAQQPGAAQQGAGMQSIQSMVMPMPYANQLPGADNNPAITPTPAPMHAQQGQQGQAPMSAGATNSAAKKPSKKPSQKTANKGSKKKARTGCC